jgi:hypothetical protein
VYSVRDRGKTTEFFAQTVLFAHAAAAAVSALLSDPALRGYACLYAQLLLLHLFVSCFLAVRRDATLTLYPLAVRTVCVLGAGMVFATYAAYTPHVDLQIVPALGALFSAELLGVVVLVASSVMRGVAAMYEEALASYA